MFFTELKFNPRGKSQRNTLLKIELSETTFVEKIIRHKKIVRNIRTKPLQDCDEYAIKKVFSQSGLKDFEKVTKQKINMAIIKEIP